MGLMELIKDLTIYKNAKELKVSQLPSQGYFYDESFWIKIKKADLEDIIEYNYYFNGENPLLIIELIKNVVRKNTFLSKGHVFEYIRAIDIVYIFLEIVKLTKDKKLFIEEWNDFTQTGDKVEICPSNFNYFQPSKKFKYDEVNKHFEYSGFRFKFPSIGIEESIFNFSNHMAAIGETKWDEHNYDFTYFLGDKLMLSIDEVQNLLIVFSEDINDFDKKTIDELIEYFKPMFKYSLRWKNKVIPLDQRVGLKTIWD